MNYKKPAFWVILLAFVAGVATSLCFLTNPKACNHRYQGQITLAATCTQKGNETFTCRDCGHTYMSMTDLCAHSYGTPKVLTPSDCVSHGQEELTCLDCGFVLVQPLPLAETVHDLQTATVKEPACGTPGQSKTYCSRCSYTEYHDLPALEHSYELTERVEPNCAHRGKEVYTCTLCDHQIIKRLPRTNNHVGSGLYCTRCWKSFSNINKNDSTDSGTDSLEELDDPRFSSGQPEFPIIWDIAGTRDPLFPGQP